MSNVSPVAHAVLLAARGLALAGLLSLACNVGALAVPLFNMQMFNSVLPTRNITTLWSLCVALGVSIATYSVLDHLRAMALEVLADRLALRLTGPVLRAIAASGPVDGRVSRPGDPLGDLECLRQFISSPVCVAPLDLIWVPVLLLVLLAMHWGYAVLGFACCVVLCAMNVLGDASSRTQIVHASHATARGLRGIAEAVRAAEPVLAMGMLPALSRRWNVQQRSALDGARRAMLGGRAIAALTRTLRMAMTGAMVALGLILVLRGDASSGSMVAGNMILARLLLPFEQISNTYRSFLEALAAWQRLREALEMPVPRRYAAALARPAGWLVVERLAHIPAGADRPVLRGLSFTLAPGEVLGVIGPSGVGKSTLLRLILGMVQPTSGGVFLDGHSTFLWEREDFASHVGYLPQSLALTDGTVAEAIARMKTPELAAVRTAAMQAGVHDALAALPNGYATRLTNFTLSGGQRQRVALARALYGSPRLLILDEPSAFLDKDGEALLRALLARLSNLGVGAIVVTHRPSLVDACDRLLVLKDGLIDRFGPRSEVLQALPGPAAMGSRQQAAVA